MTTLEIIKELKKERDELAAKAKRLDEIQRECLSLGMSYEDAQPIGWHRNKLAEKVNEIIDQINDLEKEESRMRYLERKALKSIAEQDGIDAYWKAIDDKTYQPVCQYTAKDLAKAWKKGLLKAQECYGYIGMPIYA